MGRLQAAWVNQVRFRVISICRHGQLVQVTMALTGFLRTVHGIHVAGLYIYRLPV